MKKQEFITTTRIEVFLLRFALFSPDEFLCLHREEGMRKAGVYYSS